MIERVGSCAVATGDMREVLATLPAGAFSAVVTDPPYGLSFMGKGWDHSVPGPDHWREVLRVVRPGAHLVAFGGTRTFHRLTCAIEDAGWEVRDVLSWMYGTGFPKSHNISKAIDEAAGAERQETGVRRVAADKWTEGGRRALERGDLYVEVPTSAPATDLARAAAGWGTALKPAWEPIILARAPLAGTVAANFSAHGTGGINVDGCRIESATPVQAAAGTIGGYAGAASGAYAKGTGAVYRDGGRWPANVVLDEGAARAVDAQSGERGSADAKPRHNAARAGASKGADRAHATVGGYADTGGASRFFYCAKASRSERGEGNTHPTVKPLALMRWLVRLVAPAGGIVLDPFAGSGSTLLAAREEGREAFGIELDPAHVEIIRGRLAR